MRVSPGSSLIRVYVIFAADSESRSEAPLRLVQALAQQNMLNRVVHKANPVRQLRHKLDRGPSEARAQASAQPMDMGYDNFGETCVYDDDE